MRQTKNPYLPGWEFIPDGEPKLFGDRIYVYGSHDEAEGKQYCTGDYVCWSAPADDPADWTFEGVIFKKQMIRIMRMKYFCLPRMRCRDRMEDIIYTILLQKWTSLVWQYVPHRLVIMNIMETFNLQMAEHLHQNQDMV